MSALYLDGKPIWSNPPAIGHFGIKLRKQILEDAICDRMMARHAAKSIGRYSTPRAFADYENWPK